MNIDFLKKYIAKLNYYGVNFLDNFIYFGGKLAGRIIFPVQLILNSKQYIYHQTYFPECELKTKFRIFLDQFLYILRNGEINHYFFIYGFDRKSKNDFKNYVPMLTFVHARRNKNQKSAKPEYEPYNYVCLLRDKFVFEAFCKGIGIKTPSNIGVINAGQLFLIEKNKFISIDEIKNYEIDAFCKKNVSYGGAISSDIFELQTNKHGVFINKEKINPHELKTIFGQDFWIIQESIRNQSPEYAKFHPHSINTLRIVTINTGTSVKPLWAAFRMGVNRRHADNFTTGGIIVGVNIEEGTLKKWGFQKAGFGTKSDRHPNSQIVFEGFKLINWFDVVEYVKRTHYLFYGFHSVGWDVAVTTDGIMIVEGNDNWATTYTQLYQGARKEFKKYFIAK